MSAQPPAVLLFDLHDPGLLPVVRAVAGRGLLPVIHQPRLAAAARADGLAVRTWEEFVPPDREEVLGREYLRLVDGLASAFREPEVLRAFDSPLGNPLPAIREEFFPTLLSLLLSEIAAIEQFDRLRRELDLRLLVLGADNNRVHRALIGFTRGLGLPTLQLAHGIYPVPFTRLAGEMDRLYSDRVAVFGRRARDLLVRLGNDPARIHVTGAPLWDALYAPAARRPQAEARRALGLDPTRPVILYCASYTDGSSTGLRTKTERHLAAHTELARWAVAHPARPQLLVRPHPSEILRAGLDRGERAQLLASYAAWCARRGQPVAALSFEDKADAIRAADVAVVEGSSTIVPEILLLERCPILLRGLEEPAYGEADGVLVCELPGLTAALARTLDPSGREALARRREVALPELNHGHDGRASERVAALIARLAGVGGTRPAARDAAPEAEPATRAWQAALRALLSAERAA